jgi:FMN phosphatase YigB (HAD superfamily)
VIESLVFDVGGVLAYDVWENLLLDEKEGVSSLIEVDAQSLRAAGKKLWNKFAYTQTPDYQSAEIVYWEELFDLVNRPDLKKEIDYFIALTSKFIQPVDNMTQLLKHLNDCGLTLAICSNNTEFWFKRQWDVLGLKNYFSSSRVVLSCRIGASKNSCQHKMFETVENVVGTSRGSTLFVDDRVIPVKRALEYGYSSILFPSHADFGANYVQSILKHINYMDRSVGKK